jgi:hypothetical protein
MMAENMCGGDDDCKMMAENKFDSEPVLRELLLVVGARL